MKAIVCDAYGAPEVLRMKELDKPVPKNNEVLIRIRATSVTAGDWRVRSLTVPLGFKLLMRLVLGFFKPRQPILGTELAGDIESVGSDVKNFKAGDAVFAFCGFSMGCYAQYKCLPENGALVLKPSILSYEEAAALSFGGTTALDFLRRGQFEPGETVLINGASGAVGTALVQIATQLGAKVTAVCSEKNAQLVRLLGARHVIDYTKMDFTKNGQSYDMIIDAVGNAPYSHCKNSLKKKGRLLLVVASLPAMLLAPWINLTTAHKVIAGTAAERVEDLRLLATLAEARQFSPVIDQIFPFEKMVDAHRYVDTGRKRGNVAISVAHHI